MPYRTLYGLYLLGVALPMVYQRWGMWASAAVVFMMLVVVSVAVFLGSRNGP